MKKKIGLLDLERADTKKYKGFINLALAKLSAYHKAKGDIVQFYPAHEPLFAMTEDYDIVYVSKVFTWTKDLEEHIYAEKVIYGGTGFDNASRLPDEIESIYPDYDLYNEKRAVGFLTRGCPRNCEFCIVADKEGRRSKKVANLKSFWRGQKEIQIMDPNFFACKDWPELADQLIASEAEVDFNQGIDVRILNDKMCEALNAMNIKRIHFAWDNFEIETYKKLKEASEKLKYKRPNVTVFVLTNFDTTINEDLFRIYSIRNLGFDPYVMIYGKEKLERGSIYKKLQRWVNTPMIFNSTKRFEDYQHVATLKKQEKEKKA